MVLNDVQLMAIEYTIAIIGLFLAYKCAKLKKDNMNFFMRFIVILNLFLLENIPVRLSELHLVTWSKDFVYILYAAAVILITLSAAYWSLFVLKQLKSKWVDSDNKVRLFFIPAFMSIPLCVINYCTGWLYTINENGWYTRGSIFALQAIISYGYLVVIVIGCLKHLVFDKDKSMAIKCSLCTVPSVIGAVFQVFYGGSYILAGVVITAWSMYIEICLDRQKAYELSEAVYSINDELIHSNNQIAENMKTILALSDIYYALYEVNFINDTFKEIKAPDYISEFTQNFTSTKECLSHISKEMFTSGYVGLMDIFFDYESVVENLKTNNSYFVDSVRKHKNDWIRTTVTVVERNDDGDVTRAVFSFQEIGDIIEQQKKLEEAKIYEIHAMEMEELFIQTAEALASAIDAKDQYTHGHSVRVASYAKQIAELSGIVSEEDCEKVYFAGLLHDVGKIGIPDGIISKKGRLTEEEFNEIKQHPIYGSDILDKISKLPYLSIGAKYHHERYDGSGYPCGLKGEDIPEMARIIAVADAYDAMTSRRSYRNTIPQQTVREEIVKAMGTQFDPDFAKIMIHLIDKDLEYDMQEHIGFNEDKAKELSFYENRSSYSNGIRITDTKSIIHFTYNKLSADGMPAFVLYDSGDAAVHKDDNLGKNLSYYEYGEFKLNGSYSFDGVRANNIDISEIDDIGDGECDIEIVKDKDHLYFEMKSECRLTKGTLALPDNTRFVYICMTGTDCIISNINVTNEDEPIKEGSIKRIAEPITYLNGKEGNIPSIQVDGYRTASTPGTLLENKIEIDFEMKCLPFAERIWHCPYIIIYYSDDGQLFGENYKEYGVIRLNGESWGEVEGFTNKITVNKTGDFPGWDKWKEDNKEGRKCHINISIMDNNVKLVTLFGGLKIENITEIEADNKIYVAISGDLCVIENINVNNIFNQ